MLKARTFLLAAAIGAGVPALAAAQQPGDHRFGDGGERRGDGGGRADGGQPRFGGGRPQPQAQAPQAAPPQAQAPQPAAPPQQQASGGRPDRRGYGADGRGAPGGYGATGQRFEGRGFAGRDDRRAEDFARRDDRRPDGTPDRRFERGPEGAGRPGYDPRRGYAGGDPRQGFAGNGGYRGGEQRFAYDRGARRGDDRGGRWNGLGWRQDRRYDWRGWRDQHREVFRIGRYVPPRAYYNYGYRRFDVGFRLDPFFYAADYWIDDPYAYRLPPAYGPYRWVRYYDDVLLVDLDTGKVVDVIHDFFW